MTVTTSIYGASLTSMPLVKAYLGGDTKEDFETVHSVVYDIESTYYNRIVAGLAEIAYRTRSSFARQGFSLPNATAGLTDSPLYANGDADHPHILAPWTGSIVGISCSIEAACSAGTLDLVWTKNGVNQTLDVNMESVTNVQFASSTQDVGVEDFAIGDRLGLSITTDGSFAAGTTPTVIGEIHVAYTLAGYTPA